MKKIINLFVVVTIVLGLSSCFRDNEILFDKVALVEFQETVVRAPAPGQKYPLVAITRRSGTVNSRINLVGAHRPADEAIRYKVDTEKTTAIEGVHYTLGGESAVIPANESFGNAVINILPGERQALTVDLVLVLEGNETIKPSENYKSVGYRINLNVE
jgi:hypothetical protein